MSQIKANSRITNLLHKYYRNHQTDIWGSLANADHDKLITQLIADANKAQLIAELRKYPINISIKIKREVLWGNQKATKKVFLYQLTQSPKRIKPIKKTLGATVLKNRRKLKLFYFAGRLREKTLRKFSKLHMERSYLSPHKRIAKNRFLSYVSFKSFTLFLEARLDVLFLRVESLPTMFSIRQALYHRKGEVKGQTPLNHPGFLVKMYRYFGVNKGYIKEFKKKKPKSKEKTKKSSPKTTPKYLMISNATIKKIFKVYEPLYKWIRYPFRLQSLKAFQFSHQKQ